MATYTETVFATDSYLRDAFSGALSRGASLTASSTYAFSGTAGSNPSACKLLSFDFPARAAQYDKKRLASEAFFAYVSGKENLPNPGTSLPAGSYPYSELRVNLPYFYTNGLYFNSSLLFDNIPVGAYLNITPCGVKDIGAAGGVTNGLNAGVSGISCSITMQGHTGTNKPYVVRTYEDVVPLVKNAYPQSGFVNEQAPVTFGWALNYTGYVPTPPKQASAKFRWRAQGSGTYTEIAIAGNQNSITLPAGTFTATAIEWQVVLTSDDGIAGTPSAWYTLSTVDAAPTATAISPKSELCDGSEPITFEWIHTIATGTPQRAYELQYSADNGVTWNTLVGKTVSASLSCIIPANTLPAGTVQWRVKTYNSDDVASEWSEAARIVVRAAPPAPSISAVLVSPRPMVSWQSLGQQAYHVRAGIYDSGELFGTVKSHKVPKYLSDGETVVSVRVQNSFGLWSPWADATIVIANTGGSDIALSVTQESAEVYLSWAGGHSVYYIFRDDELIAKTTEREYVDSLAIGTHMYTVMGATGDAYSVSAAIPVTAETSTWRMAVVGVWDWLPLRCRRGAKPQLTASLDQSVTYQHYEGRSLPVAEISEFVDEQYNFQMSFLVPDDARAARAMLGKVVTVKTPYGEQVTGVLGTAPWSRDRLSTDISFTIRAVDYKDVITYDV